MRFLPTIAAAALLAFTAQASAQTYSVTYTGVVAPGGTNDTNNLFGGGSLTGDAFSITFGYALQGTNDSSPDFADYYGGTAYTTASPVLTDVLTINGASFSINPSYFGELALYSGPLYKPESYTATEDASGNFIVAGLVDPTWNNVADLTLSQGDVSAYDTTNQDYGTFYYDGEEIYLDSLTVGYNGFSVPEPAAFSLMAVGVAMVGLIGRRKSQQAAV